MANEAADLLLLAEGTIVHVDGTALEVTDDRAIPDNGRGIVRRITGVNHKGAATKQWYLYQDKFGNWTKWDGQNDPKTGAPKMVKAQVDDKPEYDDMGKYAGQQGVGKPVTHKRTKPAIPTDTVPKPTEPGTAAPVDHQDAGFLAKQFLDNAKVPQWAKTALTTAAKDNDLERAAHLMGYVADLLQMLSKTRVNYEVDPDTVPKYKKAG